MLWVWQWFRIILALPNLRVLLLSLLCIHEWQFTLNMQFLLSHFTAESAWNEGIKCTLKFGACRSTVLVNCCFALILYVHLSVAFLHSTAVPLHRYRTTSNNIGSYIRGWVVLSNQIHSRGLNLEPRGPRLVLGGEIHLMRTELDSEIRDG